jgi:hypothetical protein
MLANYSRRGVDVLGVTLLVCLSLALFWPASEAGPGLSYRGDGTDPLIFIWFLNWLPYAFAHHLPWFKTNFVAWPTGIGLAWHTSVPALSLLAWPVTAKYGALTSYNLLMRLGPGLASAGAYLAARALTGKALPALIAGLVFGFSSYEMGQSLNHLNLSFTAAVPLCLWVGLRAYRSNKTSLWFGLPLGLLVAFEFGVSQEICASLLVFAAASLIGLYSIQPAQRPALRKIAPGIAVGLFISLVLVSPLLWHMLLGVNAQDHGLPSPIDYSTDLVSFFIPTPITLLGGQFFFPWTRHFVANTAEAGGYLGLPLMLLLGYIHITARAGGIRILLTLAVIAAILSLGPFIHVAGTLISTGPWLPLSLLPFFSAMLPGRFMLYAWLLIALALALWLAEPAQAIGRRYVAVLIAASFCLPNISMVDHWSDVKVPAIFTADPQHLLKPDSKILILPYVSNEMGYQYASGMKFHMVSQGYLGPGIPQPFGQWQLMRPLYGNDFTHVDPSELATFLAAYGAQQVLVLEHALADPQAAQTLLQKAGWRKISAEDGIDVYQPPPAGPENIAARTEIYRSLGRMALSERRERMNVCALRQWEAKTGINLQPLYTRLWTLPLPLDSIQCKKT